jgi:hypothetical protein
MGLAIRFVLKNIHLTQISEDGDWIAPGNLLNKTEGKLTRDLIPQFQNNYLMIGIKKVTSEMRWFILYISAINEVFYNEVS